MRRVTKGESVKQTRTIIFLLVLLSVLTLHSSNVIITQNGKPTSSEVKGSVRIFSLTSQVSNLRVGEHAEQKFNVTLWIKDWKGKIAFGNLNITLYDLTRKLTSSHLSNKTGHVDLKFLYAGIYYVSVQSGNRTVGYQMIDVKKSEKFVVKTWAYDLNLTLVDKDGKPLGNHTVVLYDQMVFQAPNYTMMTDQVVRKQNYTVLTDNIGQLVNQSETYKNGTVHFTGVWNGTYRIGILRKESWIGEYILGEYVLRYQPPASGEHILTIKEPTSIKLKCFEVDLTLKFVTESNAPIPNATVYIYDRLGHLFFKDYTNRTGFFERKNIYIIDGVYAVSARYGNRTIGYKEINVTKTEMFTVKAWAHNLTVTCVDLENRPLPDHIVFLHDQLIFRKPGNFTVVTNQTGWLVNWTRTDRNGTAYFKDVWNGTYRVRVAGGEPIAEMIINLQNVTIQDLKCNKTYLALRFVTMTPTDDPLSNATVYIQDSGGNLVFRDHTDQNGSIRHDSIYLDNYTVFAEWMGAEVWSGNVYLSTDRELTIECSVFRLALRVTDPSDNPLPYAGVVLRRKISPWRYVGPTLKLETDERGYVSRLLPSGIYEASCSSGIYSGLATINLMENYGETVRCDVQLNVWLVTLSLASPLFGLAVLLERKRLRKPLEIRRYKSMLSKLESMYKSGLVEYRLYRRLREEYEAKLMELGGREMR